jgi:flagellar biosynthetic protein FliS
VRDLSPEAMRSVSSEELALLLLRSAASAGRAAQGAAARGDVGEQERLIRRVVEIVRQLTGSLDRGRGTVSRHLAAIYAYLLRRLAVAAHDPRALEEAVSDLQELAEVWAAAVTVDASVAEAGAA